MIMILNLVEVGGLFERALREGRHMETEDGSR